MKAPNKKNSQKNHDFKGFPLIDFLDPNAFNVENILGNFFFENAIKAHIRGSDSEAHSKIYHTATSKNKGDCSCNEHKIPDKKSVGGKGRPDKDKPLFEDSLKDFFKGLYLGYFKSTEIKAVSTKPPQLYIYDIGFNTDKVTGFIVKNPFDTLISFSPRDPKYPYGRADEILDRVPKMYNIKATPLIPTPKCDEGKPKMTGVVKGLLTNLQQTLSVSNEDTYTKASIVCDLNFRVTVNNKNKLKSISMYGDTLKIHLSKGLVQAMEKSDDGKWVKTGKRFSFDVGERIITLQKNRLPSWGGKINLEGKVVSITSSNLIGKLNEINLGGTIEKPLIIFNNVEIIKQS